MNSVPKNWMFKAVSPPSVHLSRQLISYWCSLLILKHRCQPDKLTFTNVNVLLSQTGVKPKTFLRCFWEGECLLINELYECKTWSSSVFKCKTPGCFHAAFALFEETSCVDVMLKSMWKTVRRPFYFCNMTHYKMKLDIQSFLFLVD